MTRRILAISIAIVLAAFGTAGGVYLVVSADQRAQARITEAVTVVVAATRIPAGTTGARVRAEEMIRVERMPRSLVPADALAGLDTEFDGLVLTSTIEAGQMLLRANFDTRSQSTSGLALPDGTMAVTVETGAPEQVAGYVQPGSQVAIFLTYDVLGTDGRETGIQRTRVLLARVEVLAAGTYQPDGADGDRTAGTGGGSLMLTVAVNQQEAERLIEGLSHGTLYLGLLTDSVEVRPGPGVDNTDAGSGSVPLFR
jgi:pilus assembly protein CpaB